jgi:hypothetical protein
MAGTADQKLSSTGGTMELLLGSEISRILRRPLAAPNLSRRLLLQWFNENPL